MHGSYESLWISNEVYIRNASPELLANIRNVRGVTSIHKEVIVPISKPKPCERMYLNTSRPTKVQWGVRKVQAHKVWKKNVLGKGVVVANIDSGVRGTHVTLRMLLLTSD